MIKRFEIVDLAEFEQAGHLAEVNRMFFKPLGYYLLCGKDAFSGDQILQIVKATPAEDTTKNKTIYVTNAALIEVEDE